jgi:hypothetical protein
MAGYGPVWHRGLHQGCIKPQMPSHCHTPPSYLEPQLSHTERPRSEIVVTTVPFTPSPNSIERFLNLIQSAGVPATVNMAYLKGVGFRSGNDSYLIPIFKQLGFLDATATPTDSWKSYRNKSEAPKVLAAGLHKAYAELFNTYPDAHRKDDEALHNWIRAKTDLNEEKVRQSVATFRTLCKHSEFDGTPVASIATDKPPTDLTGTPPSGVTPPTINMPTAPSVTINIQLQLPPSADGDIYEKFFQAMKKYLYPDGSPSS